MAKPPEPIAELLVDAQLIVEAEVGRVLETGPEPASPEAPDDWTSVPFKTAAQRVELLIGKVLKGALAGEAAMTERISVVKPEGTYMLAAGHRGAFFLRREKDELQIIGRYGPDTYPVPQVEAALRG